MRRLLSIIVLSLLYSAVVLVCKLCSLYRRPIKNISGIILVNGTFHNPNWLHAHLTPLTQAGFKKIVLVTDSPLDCIDSLSYDCPPVFLQKIITRALSKFLWTIYCGIKYKPDLYMGYHIFPAAISILVVARLFNRPACFQATSGQLELEGGGWHAENRLLVMLQKYSKLVEKLVNTVVLQFDLVIVRGNKAKDYIQMSGYKNNIEIITGSVKMPTKLHSSSERDIDIIYVGRLTEYKRPDKFIELIFLVKKHFPNIRVAIVGEGSDRLALEKQVIEHALSDNVHFLGQRNDVLNLLSKAKIYGLTSRWEGVSIAMLEAMSNGVVPVVTNVGDLGDFVKNGKTGYIHDELDQKGMCESIVKLLSDEINMERQSIACHSLVKQKSSLKAISEKWNLVLSREVSTYN